MLKSLMTKKLNKKGFTLAELLVVVAILAILVAISVPIFTSKIEEAKKNTDAANIRAAKAAAVVEYLDKGETGVVGKYYDATNGVLVDTATDVTKYGKASTVVDGASEVPKDKILQVESATDGNIKLKWVTPAGAPAAGATR